jgi:hypothetical protein
MVNNVIKPPPANWKSHLQGNDRANAWKYAAGENKDMTVKSAKQHGTARCYIRKAEALHLICLKPEEKRTAEDQELLRKADNKRKKSRIVSRVRTGVPVDRNDGEPIFQKKLGPAPDNWNVEMDEEARNDAWRHCAGLNDNGTEKTAKQHGAARAAVITTETARLLELIRLKEEIDRTDEEKTFAEEAERRRQHINKTYSVWAQTPKGIENSKRSTAVQQTKTYTKKAATVDGFRIETGIELDMEPISDQDAFQFVLSLIDDKESVVGKSLFEALDGMTLRTAFWHGKSTSAMYALISRGAADVGGSDAESIRFLVKNHGTVPVLTHGGGIKSFKSMDQEFKDLELVYCPLKVCNTYADVTTVESAFQLLFGFLELGRHRLWKQSGQGKSKLLLRKCDMKYIKKTGDKNPKFMFGLTIIRDVSVLRRSTDPNGNETAVSILAGNGVSCDVNWPVRFAPYMDESQRVALEAVQAALPPNFMARGERKRKAEVVDDSDA